MLARLPSFMTAWDPDGVGPLPERLVVCNRTWGYVAECVADRWMNLGPTSVSAHALTTWDPDGPGPLPVLLVVAGSAPDIWTGIRVAYWTGDRWIPLGPEFSANVSALMAWDPDGAGPEMPQLIAGGAFLTIGQTTAYRIARWDGTQWQPLGEGLTGDIGTSVEVLTTWDPDGSGPLHEQLVAGGTFRGTGNTWVNRIARWDGTRWHAFNVSGIGGPVHALTSWDPDGPGPLPALLVAGGDFTVAGRPGINYIAWWNGTQWETFDSGMNARVNALTTWDPDGPGPEPARLVAAGLFSYAGSVPANRVALWDGSRWAALGGGMTTNASDFPTRLTTWDPDGAGPLHRQLVMNGTFISAGGTPIVDVGRWDGTAWHPVPGGIDRDVYAFTTWDPDGTGPLHPQLVVGGFFDIVGGISTNRVALWTGSTWRPLASPNERPFIIYSLTTWDPDGSGPIPEQIIAAGTFYTAVYYPAVARWDGSRWRFLGTISGNTIHSVVRWDPDGPGPLGEHLIAGGDFTVAGAYNIARYDGQMWMTFATTGEPLIRGTNNRVRALTTWDPDGPGPVPPQLVAGGDFTAVYGVEASFIARTNGLDEWLPLGGGMNGRVLALVVWDPDGPGPIDEQLVAGGEFTTAGGTVVNHIARWDGAVWHPLGSGMGGSSTPYVISLATWDPDGAGPMPAQLVAGGPFRSAGGKNVNFIARWDGDEWRPFGQGMNNRVLALASWDPDGPGPLPDQLVAGGYFSTAGGRPANRIAFWGCRLPPECPATSVTACSRADRDGNTVIDFNDFIAFVNDFSPQHPCADINADGMVDYDDFLHFLSLYTLGC